MAVRVGVIAIAPVPIRKGGGLNAFPPHADTINPRKKRVRLTLKAYNNDYGKTHIQCFQWLSIFARQNARKTQDVVSAPASQNSCDVNHFLARARTRRRVCLGVRFSPSVLMIDGISRRNIS